MREIVNEDLTKEILALLNSYEYVEKPNFQKYDTCSISANEDYIELWKNERYSRDDNGNYQKVSDSIYRFFKKNTVSGVFVEC